jgi:threonine synthase
MEESDRKALSSFKLGMSFSFPGQHFINNTMKYYSTNNKNHQVSLKEAVLKGLPPDNGLYMPVKIPRLTADFFENLKNLSLQEIGYAVSKAFFSDDLSEAEIKWIVEEAINFDAPLVNIHDSIFSLELFHGPTLAFKDFGARFMSRMLSILLAGQKSDVKILVATSGDTGSAVAQGFYGVQGTHVIILYPSGKVSKIQEQQIATLDKNITTLEVDGTFDDCQQLVKTAFLDESLNRKLVLSSANSINIARLIPQSFYYFYAIGQCRRLNNKQVCICVPSGNFGNLTAGLIAQQMGLDIYRFVAAVNANDTFPKYLQTGRFEPKPSVKTLSNAMDVGNPSNLGRVFDLYQHNVKIVKRYVDSDTFSDDQTRQTIKQVYQDYHYILDPHGAVGYSALMEFLQQEKKDLNGVVFETAHPGKFKDTVDEVLSMDLEIPSQLKSFMQRKKTALSISKEYTSFKEFLIKTFS